MEHFARFDVTLMGFDGENESTEYSGFVSCLGVADAIEKIEDRYGAIQSCSIRLLGDEMFIEMPKEEADEFEMNFLV